MDCEGIAFRYHCCHKEGKEHRKRGGDCEGGRSVEELHFSLYCEILQCLSEGWRGVGGFLLDVVRCRL